MTPEMEKSFRELKAKLIEAPILAHPRFDLLDTNPFIVTVDWSADVKGKGLELKGSE